MANDNLKSKILDKNSLKIKSLSFATVLIRIAFCNGSLLLDFIVGLNDILAYRLNRRYFDISFK
jgi:hypothetical protein